MDLTQNKIIDEPINMDEFHQLYSNFVERKIQINQ